MNAVLDTSPAALPRASRSSPWRTFAWAVLCMALLVFVMLLWAIGHADMAPVHITIDGASSGAHLDLAAMPPAHKVVLAVACVFAVVAALVVVPVALLLFALVLMVVLLTGIGLPLMVVLALATVLLSPFILLVLLVAWALRRPRGGGTTIQA
jgi:hypothetical protein